MNGLYKVKFIQNIILESGKCIRYIGNFNNLMYGEAGNNTKTIGNWKNLIEYLSLDIQLFEKKTLFNRIYCMINYTNESGVTNKVRLYKDEFKTAYFRAEFRYVGYDDVKMSRLIEELSVEEFMLLTKENLTESYKENFVCDERSGMEGFKI